MSNVKNSTELFPNDMQMRVTMHFHVIPAIFKSPTAPKQTYDSRSFLLYFRKISIKICPVWVYLFTRKLIKSNSNRFYGLKLRFHLENTNIYHVDPPLQILPTCAF